MANQDNKNITPRTAIKVGSDIYAQNANVSPFESSVVQNSAKAVLDKIMKLVETSPVWQDDIKQVGGRDAIYSWMVKQLENSTEKDLVKLEASLEKKTYQAISSGSLNDNDRLSTQSVNAAGQDSQVLVDSINAANPPKQQIMDENLLARYRKVISQKSEFSDELDEELEEEIEEEFISNLSDDEELANWQTQAESTEPFISLQDSDSSVLSSSLELLPSDPIAADIYEQTSRIVMTRLDFYPDQSDIEYAGRQQIFDWMVKELKTAAPNPHSLLDIRDNGRYQELVDCLNIEAVKSIVYNLEKSSASDISRYSRTEVCVADKLRDKIQELEQL